MKNKPGLHSIGNILIFISIIGIVFSITGIAITWYMKPKIQKSVHTIIDTLDKILVNTDDALLVLDSTLEGSIENLDIIAGTLENLETTIDNISISLDSSADLIGGDLRLTIIDTQTALSSAATSAGLIDKTLRFLAAIPLLGADYRPDVPLSTSLEQVSGSLNDIPEAFLDIEKYIGETSEGLAILKSDVEELSGNLRFYEQDLENAREVISEYNQIIDDLLIQIREFRDQSSNLLLIASILITGGFFLLGISQISTFQQGTYYRKGEVAVINLADLKREQSN